MSSSHLLRPSFFIIAVIIMVFRESFVEADFADTMCGDWGSQHSKFQGDTDDDAALMLDQVSGSGIQSKKLYLFGSFQMLIKLVPGNSAGTVTAFFLSSSGGKNRDEIDFEFLGNVSGQPYVIHTNIFTDGGGGREVQFYPWFDPTADYHNYTIHWLPSEVVWYVDNIPIRVYRNYGREGIPYPHKQAMRVYSSIWNADSWATRGGLDKIQWDKAPFVSRLRQFRPRACEYGGPGSISKCSAAEHLNMRSRTTAYKRLNDAEKQRMRSVREKYMVYDYCNDQRYNGLFPGECLKEQY